MNQIILFVALITMPYLVNAYTFTFTNNFNKPISFWVEYGSAFCRPDNNIQLNPGDNKTITTGGCCWHTITIVCNNKSDTFQVIDVYPSILGAFTFPACRDQKFSVNADGYFVVKSFEYGENVVKKLTGV